MDTYTHILVRVRMNQFAILRYTTEEDWREIAASASQLGGIVCAELELLPESYVLGSQLPSEEQMFYLEHFPVRNITGLRVVEADNQGKISVSRDLAEPEAAARPLSRSRRIVDGFGYVLWGLVVAVMITAAITVPFEWGLKAFWAVYLIGTVVLNAIGRWEKWPRSWWVLPTAIAGAAIGAGYWAFVFLLHLGFSIRQVFDLLDAWAAENDFFLDLCVAGVVGLWLAWEFWVQVWPGPALREWRERR